MCDPVTLAIGSFVVAAAQSGASFMSQSQQASAQNKAYDANARNAAAAYEDNVRAIGRQQAQQQDATAADKFDTALEARAARASTTVAADQNGIGGNSPTIDGLLRDIYAQEGRYNGRLDENLDWSTAQLQDEKRGKAYQMVNQVNSVAQGQKPNFMSLGLQIAGAGLNAGSTYYEQKTAQAQRTEQALKAARV